MDNNLMKFMDFGLVVLGWRGRGGGLHPSIWDVGDHVNHILRTTTNPSPPSFLSFFYMHAFIARHVLTISLLKTKTPFHSFRTPPRIHPPTKCLFFLEKLTEGGVI